MWWPDPERARLSAGTALTTKSEMIFSKTCLAINKCRYVFDVESTILRHDRWDSLARSRGKSTKLPWHLPTMIEISTANNQWLAHHKQWHYSDVIMGAIASQITNLAKVYSTVYSDADQRKHQSSASLAFVQVIHRGPVNSPHKWPVARKIFPFDDVIMGNSVMEEMGVVA